ncbi:UDP-glucose/GDP-mannose dehydrogenase family protein [bacterium]|nr:UDP-glucose/GDP-mannose dehydrogenase family protein [bacterium]
MRVAVIGTGYVGLVAATCFADSGNTVITVDKIEAKIKKLLNGEIPIFEPGLEEMVKRNLAAKRLIPTTDMRYAIENSDVIFSAVGTPTGADGKADLSAVWAVMKEIAPYFNGYKIVVNKSTVPVGTAAKVKEVLSQGTTQPFDVVSNPEFLKEGAALDDFLKPERVVIGTTSPEAAEKMKLLYDPFTKSGADILVMDNKSAEMCKYASNAMLATRISFMNEIANICSKVGADVTKVRIAMGLDSRIGRRFLYSGIGYGGSCFPKDVKALAATARENGYEPIMIDAIEKVNAKQKELLFELAKEHFKGDLKGKTIAMWGLAFKPQTDDMRDAPSRVIIKLLLEAGAKVKGYDPVAKETAKAVFGDSITYCEEAYETLEGCDALMLVTEWNEFRVPDFPKIKSLLKTPVIFDGRNQYSPSEMKELGFTYYSIGRPTVK